MNFFRQAADGVAPNAHPQEMLDLGCHTKLIAQEAYDAIQVEQTQAMGCGDVYPNVATRLR